MFGSWIEHQKRNNRQSSWIETLLVSLQELPNYLEIGELNIWYCNIWIRRLLESYNAIFSLDHLPKFPHKRQRRTYGWKHEPCSLWSSGLPKLVCLDPLRGIPCFQTNKPILPLGYAGIWITTVLGKISLEYTFLSGRFWSTTAAKLQIDVSMLDPILHFGLSLGFGEARWQGQARLQKDSSLKEVHNIWSGYVSFNSWFQIL